jgi:hypothetical protein
MSLMDKQGRESPVKLAREERRRDADKGMAEYRTREDAANMNMLRLRALRLAHEAANPPAQKTAKRAKPKKSESLSQYLKRETDAGRGT